jgi:succinate dehydrogenase/fumarate reductase flavoprotein subunit
MEDLTNFNKEYRLYLTCKNGVSFNTSNPLHYFDKTICNGNTKTRTNLDAAYNNLTNPDQTGSLDILTTAVNGLSTNTGGTDLSQYNRNYYDILTKYNEVVKNRQSMDAKLAELYQIGDTTSNFYQKKLVSTSYTKILLTVLATGLVVTAFVVAQRKK